MLRCTVPVSISWRHGQPWRTWTCLLKSRGVVYVYSMARGSLGVCQGTDAHTCSTRDEYMVGGHPAPAPRVANGGEQSSEGARGRYYPVMRFVSPLERHRPGMPRHAASSFLCFTSPFVLSLASPVTADLLVRRGSHPFEPILTWSEQRLIHYLPRQRATTPFFSLVPAWTFLGFLQSACFVSFSDMPVSITNTLGK